MAACSGAPLGTSDDIVLEFMQTQTLGTSEIKHFGDATVSGTVDLALRANPRFTEVQFHVDDPARREAPIHVDDAAPFTVQLDTRTLADGVHNLTVVAQADRGKPALTSVAFTVDNGGGTGDDDAGATGGTDDGATDEATDPSDDGDASTGGDTDDGAGDAPGTIDPVVEEPEDDTVDAGPDPFAVPEATLYVSPGGSDANDGRSSDRALRTIQAAADRVQPGDVVHLRGGVYTGEVKFRRSGTQDAPIVWTSAPGEWAVLDLSGYAVGGKQRIWVYGADHNQFLNFEVRNSPNQGIFLQGSSHNLFRNILTHHNHGSGIHNYEGSYNRYEYVTSHSNYDHSSDRPGEDADGIGLKFGAGNSIYASVVYGNSDDGFDTWQSTDTVIESSISHHNGYGRYGNGNGFKLGSSGYHVRTVVRDSIAYANAAVGFTWNGGHDVTFVNNTSVDNRRAFEADSTATLVNNIAVGGDLSLSGATARRNSWNLSLAIDFASTDPSDADFLALAAGSAALTAGVDGSHLGAVRPGATYADLLAPNALAGLGSQQDTLALHRD